MRFLLLSALALLLLGVCAHAANQTDADSELPPAPPDGNQIPNAPATNTGGASDDAPPPPPSE